MEVDAMEIKHVCQSCGEVMAVHEPRPGKK